MEIKSVLSKIASELGFSDIDPNSRTLQTDDVDEFAQAIVLAEGLAPEWEGGNLIGKFDSGCATPSRNTIELRSFVEIAPSLE